MEYVIWNEPFPFIYRADLQLYYANQNETPKVHQYISIVNLLIASVGLGAGLASMRDANILFDGASLGMSMFHTSSYPTLPCDLCGGYHGDTYSIC